MIVGLTGGIGSGKSVVAKILRIMGYAVYDCDIEAREIMNDDPEIRCFLKEEISEGAFDAEGNLNRRAISEVIFNSTHKRLRLNEIVHRKVKEDFMRFAESRKGETVFVESAILFQSGLNRIVDKTIEVTADVETRVRRVAERNGFTESHIRSRIEAQAEEEQMKKGADIIELHNDNHRALLPQILEILAQLEESVL